MTMTMKISGMHCQGCSSSLQKALAGHRGVAAAAVDLAAATAEVEYDEAATSREALKKAVEEAGFEVVG